MNSVPNDVKFSLAVAMIKSKNELLHGAEKLKRKVQELEKEINFLRNELNEFQNYASILEKLPLPCCSHGSDGTPGCDRNFQFSAAKLISASCSEKALHNPENLKQKLFLKNVHHILKIKNARNAKKSSRASKLFNTFPEDNFEKFIMVCEFTLDIISEVILQKMEFKVYEVYLAEAIEFIADCEMYEKENGPFLKEVETLISALIYKLANVNEEHYCALLQQIIINLSNSVPLGRRILWTCITQIRECACCIIKCEDAFLERIAFMHQNVPFIVEIMMQILTKYVSRWLQDKSDQEFLASLYIPQLVDVLKLLLGLQQQQHDRKERYMDRICIKSELMLAYLCKIWSFLSNVVQENLMSRDNGDIIHIQNIATALQSFPVMRIMKSTMIP